MQSLGEWILAAGPNGMFAYGVLNRLLIPTGLHHILQNLLQFVIGAATIGGKVYTGEVPRFFAGDPNAGYIMAGWYIVMMFSIPAACLAITHEAKPSERRRVGGLMGTAALTSLMLGITEPAEFAFMFAAPVLFGVHAVLTGLALWVSRLLAVRHWGFALPLYIANLKLSQNALLLLPVGVAFALVYYFLFRFLIHRFDLPTPGRRDFAVDSAATAAAAGGGSVTAAAPTAAVSAPERTMAGRARGYLAALGGVGNVRTIEACMTRLRVQLKNPASADTAAMTALGASGVTRPGHDLLQVVVGTDAELIKTEIAALLHVVVVQAPLSGRVVPLSELPDAVFAGGMVGPGIAIDPTDGRLVAPVDGEILQVHGAKHAVVMAGPGGLELLLHMGLDTVELDGVGFSVHCQAGERVAAGQLLAEFDPEAVRAAGKSTLSPIIILNQDSVTALAPTAAPAVRAGSDALLTVTMK
jgi:PTS system D-glucosamine-specific IIC component